MSVVDITSPGSACNQYMCDVCGESWVKASGISTDCDFCKTKQAFDGVRCDEPSLWPGIAFICYLVLSYPVNYGMMLNGIGTYGGKYSKENARGFSLMLSPITVPLEICTHIASGTIEEHPPT